MNPILSRLSGVFSEAEGKPRNRIKSITGSVL